MPRHVAWLGSSPCWPGVPQPAGTETFLMPLIEEHVLEVAATPSPHRKLSLDAALNCCSKFRLRRALEGTGLNPNWISIPWMPGVVKAPAGVANQGVARIPSNEYITRLALYCPMTEVKGVIEEFIEGPQREVDGVAVGGCVEFLATLQQEWAGNKIVRYRPCESTHELREAVKKAITAVGLDDCCYSAELRQDGGSDGEWKLIDLHARLGEDEGLADLLSGGDNPLEVVERLVAARAVATHADGAADEVPA